MDGGETRISLTRERDMTRLYLPHTHEMDNPGGIEWRDEGG